MLVFVLGTGRCGSTLVQEVLARHPDVAFVSNVEDRFPLPPRAGRLNNTLWRALPPSAAQKGRARYAPSEAYRALDREVSPMLSTPDRDLVAGDVTPWLAGRLRAFVNERWEAQGKPAFLHKLTGWPRAGLLAEVFPEARFVHVVRDGRAVANSWLQMAWWPGYRGPEGWSFGPLSPAHREEYERSDRSFVTLAGIGWKLLMDAYEQARAALPADRWLDVRYEDVLADPAGRFAEMLDFAGLPPDDRFDAELARYRFSTSRRAAYAADLGPENLRRLEDTLAEHLPRYGYATDAPVTPPQPRG